jgi:hypothetical protein
LALVADRRDASITNIHAAINCRRVLPLIDIHLSY